MSGAYLFGFLRVGDAPAISAAISGHSGFGHGVGVLVAGRLAAIWAEIGTASLRPTRRNLTGHARLVELAHAAAPVLPVAYGHVSPGREAVAALAGANSEMILSELDRLGDRVEFGVRVTGCRDGVLRRIASERPDWQRLPASFEARIALGRAIGDRIAALRAAAQSRLLEAIAPALADRIIRAPEDDCELLRAEVLVERSGEAALSDRLDAVVPDLDFAPDQRPRVRLVGPSPAYAFVRLTLPEPATVAENA